MAGAQIAWTVELGYGTPFLLGLGLSEQLTSLVWLAGPISGLVAQPVIGAVSDSSTSKYRRRFWIILSTVALVISTFTLAYCQSLAAFFVDLFDIGAGDWDEERNKRVASTAIGFAVVSFYVLDFALNGLQASLRNLLLDITPANQLNAGNAWHGRMTNAGNIIGFGFGFLPLAKLPIIRLLGGDQFRKFCVICIIILVITVWMTCFFHEEQERPTQHEKKSTFTDVLGNIYTAIVNLPKPIRRVCYVQLFAFMGWFPFLFYSTTYMGQVMAYELQREPDHDIATRTGEFALLLYSIVGVIAGTILPHLATRDRRLMAHRGDINEDAEVTRLRNTVHEWRVEAARQGKPLRLPVMPFLLRNVWTGALLFFSLLMFSTLFIATVFQATIFISLVGICWAVAMWVPFSIIMELLKEGSNPTPEANRRPNHTRNLSTSDLTRLANDERQPLLRRRSYNESDYEIPSQAVIPQVPLAGGTVLGIHNLAIVMPQFIPIKSSIQVALVTSAIFRIVDKTSSGFDIGDENTYLGHNGVAWVLRFGGVCTLCGALIARMVPPTPTEKAMRRRLGEMKLLEEEGMA
ncbi:hypothetical protein AMATHDRAFT_73959 [Amanita thiersii Skay4041]|uniref:MFS general substrate transporter n=1 Tax=Amanita thiersii Skay4041 TaxID=703135 RepID=A0A2A9NU00_9AGAR|nr:hypothetical protein AMATHDRAFT_73959 [Amanita thiersii Skay4041]